MKKIFILIGVFAVGIISTFLFVYVVFQTPAPCDTGRTAFLRTPQQTLTVAVASTPQQQARGLGECKRLTQNTGMYFPFSVASPQTFWMKDMIIPIDIVWISQGKVVGVLPHVPFFPPGTGDSLLPLYRSPQNVDAVLEIGAGTADSYGLTNGSPVQLLK